VQRRNSFDCRCRSDILSARYCAGGDGAARHPYHRAKHGRTKVRSLSFERRAEVLDRSTQETPGEMMMRAGTGNRCPLSTTAGEPNK